MVHLPGVCLPGAPHLCGPVLVACPLPGRGGCAGPAGRPTRFVLSLLASFTIRQVADGAVVHLPEPERPVENAVQQLAQAGFVDVADTSGIEAKRVRASVQIKDRYGSPGRRGVSRIRERILWVIRSHVPLLDRNGPHVTTYT